MNSLAEKTLAVVVTFNPEISLLRKNLQALNSQFSRILIVDNGSKNAPDIEKLAKEISTNIKVDKLKNNLGIAYAQNVGLEAATSDSLPWILTMDQDSVIPENLSGEYEKVIEKFDNIGLVGWNQRPVDQKKDEEIIRNDWYVLSSGCLMSVEALNQVKGFDNELFIDHVDTDANIKIRNLGYRTLTTNKVHLTHNLGTPTNKKTIRGNAYITHSPIRIYYNVRNGVTLFRRYFFRQPGWTMIAIFNNIRECVYLLLYQPDKLKNLGLLSRAWFDGAFNKLGKISK